MAGIETIYLGELRTEATHKLSGTKIMSADREFPVWSPSFF